jgi:hypothetical protein
LTEKPDFELDAYLCRDGLPGPLCDVRMWLPKQPSDDVRIEVGVVDPSAGNLQQLDGMTLDSGADQNFRFEAGNLLIRSAVVQPYRRAMGARLNIEHIGLLSIRNGPPIREAASSGTDFGSVVFRLSEIRYGVPSTLETADYLGNRTLKRIDDSPLLEMGHSSGFSCQFLLERHWTWTSDKKAVAVIGRSCPVFLLESMPKHPAVSLRTLSECADDAALFLSLASRWRVVVQSWTASIDATHIQEWRYPLKRLRAVGLEREMGYLVDSQRVADFFVGVSKSMEKFDEKQKVAVRHAIVAMHSTFERTIEGKYLAMFSALDGLTSLFGSSHGTFRSRLESMHAAHPPCIGGLWSIVGTKTDWGLYQIRNAVAHGDVSPSRSWGIAIASDHLRVWLEYSVLSILNLSAYADVNNWLADHVRAQRDKVVEAKRMLNAS